MYIFFCENYKTDACHGDELLFSETFVDHAYFRGKYGPNNTTVECGDPPILDALESIGENRLKGNGFVLKGNCHTRLHLRFSAKLRIWQVPACKMEPQSGSIYCKNPIH